ncbi:MAG: riboflavin synthase [Sphingobacteriia bacterium]|jgi:riboflavin synthase|nr:MAG: riboflavin synthase [Sphingobacteriia bacterium]TAG31847.1 MAG: riboflavin synthase [Sphingobacteriia bacterium]TAH07857.1 MAG: riboflavin synthase [Sphingobacteriia bacterium]
MFTGIIETIGTVEAISQNGSNYSYQIRSAIGHELKVDQSLAHEGVCLTVEAIEENLHQVTAIAETISKTNLAQWKQGTKVNIERCMVMNGRLDGHIVQGHVDCTAICTNKIDRDGSWEYQFEFPEQFAPLVIEKGSISVNGTSLTCFSITNNSFQVAIIPYTYHHTSIQQVEVGSVVNIEFDLIGKYVHRSNNLITQ